MPTEIVWSIIALLIMVITGYLEFRKVYKSKKVPIEWKVVVGLVNVAPLYVIYQWVKLYVETGAQP